jgi:hypothetical protein
MDGRTKPNEFYITDRNNNTLDEDNVEDFDEAINDTSGCSWPSATVKSPGFFKLGSCFSFF